MEQRLDIKEVFFTSKQGEQSKDNIQDHIHKKNLEQYFKHQERMRFRTCKSDPEICQNDQRIKSVNSVSDVKEPRIYQTWHVKGILDLKNPDYGRLKKNKPNWKKIHQLFRLYKSTFPML